MWDQVDRILLLLSEFLACLVLGLIQIGSTAQATVGLGGADILQGRFVVHQRLTAQFCVMGSK